MYRIIPELKGKERESLFIIGNGFDLYHGLKTSYKDFHDWLLKYGYEDFVQSMEKAFPELYENAPLLWKDFEKALGLCDPKKIHKDFFQGVNDGWYDKGIQKRVAERIEPILNRISELLRSWIEHTTKNVLLDNCQPFELSDESLYLSFNYTMLLENVYGIHRILHIHNKIEDAEPLITGHNSGFCEDKCECDDINEEYSMKNIARVLNRLRKPVDTIIDNHQSFFNSLGNITQVVVFGSSLSEIDRPYFTEVLHHVHDDAKWHFICHDEQAQTHYKHIVESYNNSLKNRIDAFEYRKKMTLANCDYIDIKKS